MDFEPESANSGERSLDLAPHPDVVARRVGDEMVLVHLKTNQIYALNRTAAKLWGLLDEGYRFDAALAEMKRLFDVPEPELEDECERFFAHLKKSGLLKPGSRARVEGGRT